MTDRQETIADIIAEKRFDATTRDQFDSAYIVDFCDRLEAAHKREKAAIEADALAVGGIVEAARKRERGDRAKLREALMKCQEITLQWQADERLGVAGSVEKPEARSASDALIDIEFVAHAALDAPPRNCDRFATLPDALAAWRDIDPREAGPFDLWLFAPATEKEGESDGSK